MSDTSGNLAERKPNKRVIGVTSCYQIIPKNNNTDLEYKAFVQRIENHVLVQRN